jgi:hypothetical protein
MERTLTSEEKINPFQSLDSIFSCSHFQQLQEELTKIEDQLFNKSYSHERDSRDHDETVYVFEQLHRLIQSSFIIHTRHQGEINPRI